MVAKTNAAVRRKAVVRAGSKAKKAAAKEAPKSGLAKIRIGVIVGKDFDPVKKGTQWPEFPGSLCLTKDDWGKFSADAATAVKMQQLHPDLLEVDVIPNREANKKRLVQNHVNLNFWGDVGVALMTGDKKHIAEVERNQQDPECRMYPEWDFYHWMVCKPRYMEQCRKAGIPMIPTVIYKNGFDPKKCMRDVQKQGWDKFFCKVGYHSFFGQGAINGKTADFLGEKFKELEAYAEENKKSKFFLLQPYTLKPNGEVFDEVRNFFVDGEWRYSVFTHGTDESDAGYYAEPEGVRKTMCKALAERVYQEVLKVSKWHGKRQRPLLNRIDIGVIPSKGGDSLHKNDNKYFLNEVEPMQTTWLDRYAPISVQDVMAQVSVKQSLELVAGLLKTKQKLPNGANLRKTVRALNERLGPFKHVRVSE